MACKKRTEILSVKLIRIEFSDALSSSINVTCEITGSPGDYVKLLVSDKSSLMKSISKFSIADLLGCETRVLVTIVTGRNGRPIYIGEKALDDLVVNRAKAEKIDCRRDDERIFFTACVHCDLTNWMCLFHAVVIDDKSVCFDCEHYSKIDCATCDYATCRDVDGDWCERPLGEESEFAFEYKKKTASAECRWITVSL